MRKQMKKNLGKKAISVILVCTMLTTGILQNGNVKKVGAESDKVGQEQTENKTEKALIVKELINERTENSSTYLLSDGSKKLKIMGENIRYEEDGTLKEYDTSLSDIDKSDKKEIEKTVAGNTPDDFAFVNSEGDSKQYFPSELSSDSEIVMSKEKYSLSFSPCIEGGNAFKASVKDDEIIYTSSDEEIEYQYISLKNGVKENVILNSRPKTNEIQFILKGKKVVYELQENEEISIKDKSTGEQVGKFVAPNIVDNDGKVDYTKVKYELVKEEKDTVLKVVIDEEYLNDENTKYPLTVDPTAVWFGDKLPAAIVNSVTGRSDDVLLGNSLVVENNYEYNETKDKRSSKVYIDTSNLIGGTDWLVGTPEISGKYIENSYLYIGEQEASKEYVQVDVKSVKSAWNVNTVTWNSQPEISDKVIATTWNKGEDGRNHGVNLTKWVQAIADGEEENHGLVLEAAEEGTQCSYYGTLKPGANFMCIDIIYRDMEKYDGTVSMTAEYNSETGMVETKIEDENKLAEGVKAQGYKVFARKDNADKFVSIYEGKDITEKAELSVEDIEAFVDYRVCILYSDGKVMPSNIVTLEKSEEEESDEDGNAVNDFSQISKDTDGDGLEDGYEIWDFKTKWNEKNGKGDYIQDSDGDGFPDSYEVFTLGTDPAAANPTGNDSDGDYLDDFAEYRKGTNPWLKDSDFDGDIDSGDEEPLFTNDQTDKEKALAAKVHIGLYDAEYITNENGVKETCIKNIYNGLEKSIEYDYGDNSINKEILHFYNANNQEIAVIERINTYDQDSSTQSDKNVICITYSYDEKGNNILICDQKTRYNMLYDINGALTEIKVGNDSIIKYSTNDLLDVDNSDNIENKYEKIEEYGNGQKKRIVTTNYEDVETNSSGEKMSSIVEVYFDDEASISYKSEFDEEGELIKFVDYTQGDNPIEYGYQNDENKTIITRNDGFQITESNSTNDNKNTTELKYNFTNIKGNTEEKSQTLVEEDNEKQINSVMSGYNGEKYNCIQNIENGNSVNIVKDNNSTEMFRSSIVNTSDNQIDYKIIGKVNKNIVYQLNGVGNIIRESVNGNNTKTYGYDGHGRLIEEKNLSEGIGKRYIYNSTGNMTAEWTYTLTDAGEIPSTGGTVKYFTYSNGSWKDLLIRYAGETISYDESGNPETYRDGYSLSWKKGRELKQIYKGNSLIAAYKYDQNGLRTQKKTNHEEHNYEWEKTHLIRETVTYTNRTYDIWYMYAGDGGMVGFEYSYIDTLGELQKEQIYFEKNYQGDVIGLLDSEGNELVTYEYDTWGNIMNHTVNQGGEIPYMLNNIGYRQYYMDKETGFYYLQSRYYDAVTHRFLNADGVDMLFANTSEMFEDNLFIYCNGNPVNSADSDGRWYYRYYDYEKYLKRLFLLYAPFTGAYRYAISKQLFYNGVKAEVSNNTKYYAKRSGELYDAINGQNLYPYTKMKYGVAPISYNGCEIIATYNVMKFLGKYTYFPMLIAEFSINGMRWNNGSFGTNPENLSKYFNAHSVKYTKYSTKKKFEKSTKKHQYYIVSYWVEGAPRKGGIHTVAVRAMSNGSFTAYNYETSKNKTSRCENIKELYTEGKRYSCIYGFD